MKLCTYISLMTNDDELFMGSLTISLFYLKKHTTKSFAYVEIFFIVIHRICWAQVPCM